MTNHSPSISAFKVILGNVMFQLAPQDPIPGVWCTGWFAEQACSATLCWEWTLSWTVGSLSHFSSSLRFRLDPKDFIATSGNGLSATSTALIERYCQTFFHFPLQISKRANVLWVCWCKASVLIRRYFVSLGAHTFQLSTSKRKRAFSSPF